MPKTGIFLIICSSIFYAVSAQHTVGLFVNDSLALNGYTLYAPSSSTETYLVDNCGFIINQWSSAHRPGQSVYLLEDGSLLRTARIQSNFNSGGSGGRIEKYNWEGELTWEINYSSDTYHQHHDVAPMPNGHVLILAWEKITREEAIALGRDPNSVSNSGLWPEHIVEVRQVGMEGFEPVWEWHLQDHFVQSLDTTLANFGLPSEHPELIDLNYTMAGGQAGGTDMIHANSIDYNPELDQIILSSRVFSEIWVIDHSTTTMQAAGHEGGNSGMGGDIIYRYGNPRMYGRGTINDQVFFGQHDARWIPQGFPGAGNIIIYNNGQGRPGIPFSSADVITPPWDSALQTYTIAPGLAYEPKDLLWRYDGGDTAFYSSNISGAQPLDNGNVLICIGSDGEFREVTPDGEMVWKYVSPVGTSGPVAQGDEPNVKSVFRATRLPACYPAFIGRELIPGERVEINPLQDDCEIFDADTMTTSTFFVREQLLSVRVLGNPFGDQLIIHSEIDDLHVQCRNLSGRLLLNANLNSGINTFSTEEWPAGMILVTAFSGSGGPPRTFKLIKASQ